ncbi:unnamed protein product, partial [Bubo scandiacus]
MPLPCLHHGNDINKWRPASHRHGVTGSRSTTACGRDGNDTGGLRGPAAQLWALTGAGRCFESPRQGFWLMGLGQVFTWRGGGKEGRGERYHPLGKVLRSACPESCRLGGVVCVCVPHQNKRSRTPLERAGGGGGGGEG